MQCRIPPFHGVQHHHIGMPNPTPRKRQGPQHPRPRELQPCKVTRRGGQVRKRRQHAVSVVLDEGAVVAGLELDQNQSVRLKVARHYVNGRGDARYSAPDHHLRVHWNPLPLAKQLDDLQRAGAPFLHVRTNSRRLGLELHQSRPLAEFLVHAFPALGAISVATCHFVKIPIGREKRLLDLVGNATPHPIVFPILETMMVYVVIPGTFQPLSLPFPSSLYGRCFSH